MLLFGGLFNKIWVTRMPFGVGCENRTIAGCVKDVFRQVRK